MIGVLAPVGISPRKGMTELYAMPAIGSIAQPLDAKATAYGSGIKLLEDLYSERPSTDGVGHDYIMRGGSVSAIFEKGHALELDAKAEIEKAYGRLENDPDFKRLDPDAQDELRAEYAVEISMKIDDIGARKALLSKTGVSDKLVRQLAGEFLEADVERYENGREEAVAAIKKAYYKISADNFNIDSELLDRAAFDMIGASYVRPGAARAKAFDNDVDMAVAFENARMVATAAYGGHLDSMGFGAAERNLYLAASARPDKMSRLSYAGTSESAPEAVQEPQVEEPVPPGRKPKGKIPLKEKEKEKPKEGFFERHKTIKKVLGAAAVGVVATAAGYEIYSILKSNTERQQRLDQLEPYGGDDETKGDFEAGYGKKLVGPGNVLNSSVTDLYRVYVTDRALAGKIEQYGRVVRGGPWMLANYAANRTNASYLPDNPEQIACMAKLIDGLDGIESNPAKLKELTVKFSGLEDPVSAAMEQLEQEATQAQLRLDRIGQLVDASIPADKAALLVDKYAVLAPEGKLFNDTVVDTFFPLCVANQTTADRVYDFARCENGTVWGVADYMKKHPEAAVRTPTQWYGLARLLYSIDGIGDYPIVLAAGAEQADCLLYQYGLAGNTTSTKNRAWNRFAVPGMKYIANLVKNGNITIDGFTKEEIGRLLLPIELTEYKVHMEDGELYAKECESQLGVGIENVNSKSILNGTSLQEWLTNVGNGIYNEKGARYRWAIHDGNETWANRWPNSVQKYQEKVKEILKYDDLSIFIYGNGGIDRNFIGDPIEDRVAPIINIAEQNMHGFKVLFGRSMGRVVVPYEAIYPSGSGDWHSESYVKTKSGEYIGAWMDWNAFVSDYVNSMSPPELKYRNNYGDFVRISLK